MNATTSFFTRWRVRLGYVLALAVFWLARPSPRTIAWGGLVGIFGLALRGYAAGHLRKQESLTTTGPYAHTRNPLYLGSSILTVGLAIASKSWLAAILLLAYFTIFYGMVMRQEEKELRAHFGPALDEYVRVVPLFLPRLLAARISAAEPGAFSWAHYKKNHEYETVIGFALILVLLVVICWLRSR